jgi:hypothetical protein
MVSVSKPIMSHTILQPLFSNVFSNEEVVIGRLLPNIFEELNVLIKKERNRMVCWEMNGKILQLFKLHPNNINSDVQLLQAENQKEAMEIRNQIFYPIDEVDLVFQKKVRLYDKEGLYYIMMIIFVALILLFLRRKRLYMFMLLGLLLPFSQFAVFSAMMLSFVFIENAIFQVGLVFLTSVLLKFYGSSESSWFYYNIGNCLTEIGIIYFVYYFLSYI